MQKITLLPNAMLSPFMLKISTLMLIMLTVIFASQHVVAAPKKAELRSLKISSVNGKLRLNFQLSAPAKYKAFTLPSPERVVIDFKNTVALPNALKPSGTSAIAPINRVRHSIRNGNDLRVVLDMETSVGVMANARKVKHGANVEVILSHSSIKRVPNKGKDDSVVAKRTPAKRETSAPKAVNAPAPRAGDFVIVIDAGHGGKDPGAVGPGGLREKDVALSISKKLRDKINNELGMRAVMTRSNDRFIDLRERIRKAGDHNADLFISVHANGNPSRRVSGSSVYILSQSGASSEAARFIAARENAYFGRLGTDHFQGKNKMIRSVLLDLSKSSTLERSYNLASGVLKEMGRVNNLQRNSVESAAFVVLKSLHIPSMLVETAHISNPQEEKQLSQNDFQNQLANSIFRGVKRYYRTHAPKAARNYAGDGRYVVKSGDTLSGIAQKHRVSMSRIKQVNKLSSNNIKIGQKLKIP
jgi:N-acetylmuramoyl-L-alanine amidase